MRFVKGTSWEEGVGADILEDALGYLNNITSDPQAVSVLLFDLVHRFRQDGDNGSVDMKSFAESVCSNRVISVELVFGNDAIDMWACADCTPSLNVLRVNMARYPTCQNFAHRKSLVVYYLILLIQEFCHICTDDLCVAARHPNATVTDNSIRKTPEKLGRLTFQQKSGELLTEQDCGFEFELIHMNGCIACVGGVVKVVQVVNPVENANAPGNLKIKTVPLNRARVVLETLDKYLADRDSGKVTHLPAEIFRPLNFESILAEITTNEANQEPVIAADIVRSNTPIGVTMSIEEAEMDEISHRLNFFGAVRNTAIRW